MSRTIHQDGTETWTWSYNVQVMAGPTVRLEGEFAEFSGSITVRPPEEGDLKPHIAWSGAGKVNRSVREVAEYHWGRARVGL